MGSNDADGGGGGGLTDLIASVASGVVERAHSPSLFKPVGDGILGAHGVIDEVQVAWVETPERARIAEKRSGNDLRPRLNVANKGDLYDWMRENVGSDMVPGMFRRDASLVRVPQIGENGYEPPGAGEDDGPAQIRVLNAGSFADIIQHRFWLYTETVKKSADDAGDFLDVRRRHTLVPMETARLAIDGATEWRRIPMLRSVTHTPTVREDGSLVTLPGFDDVSGILYLPDRGLQPVDMPVIGSITPGWLEFAQKTLDYLVCDFPFEKPGHKANYIAMLLTPLVRRVVPPPYPMFALNAHQRGTGKSLLARVARTLHGGIHRPEMPTDDEELRKQITSILTMTTAPMVNWDNSTAPIRSGQIANLLTTAHWSDRPLGATAHVEATNDRVWMVTGNNIRLGGDMARRVQWISIDAHTPRPEQRVRFHERDLVGYVTANRGVILTALLTVVGYWVQRGMPVVAESERVRSDDYARWADVMQQMLDGVGMGEGFARVDDFETVESEDETELWEFLDGLYKGLGSREWTVGDLKILAAGVGWAEYLTALLPGIVKEKKDPWKSLGWYLKNHEKQFARDKRLVKMGDARTGAKWMIELSTEKSVSA
jgi:hypothetical protein